MNFYESWSLWGADFTNKFQTWNEAELKILIGKSLDYTKYFTEQYLVCKQEILLTLTAIPDTCFTGQRPQTYTCIFFPENATVRDSPSKLWL